MLSPGSSAANASSSRSTVGVPIRRPRRIEATAGAEHRPRQPLRGAQPAGELDRLHERRARVRPAGCQRAAPSASSTSQRAAVVLAPHDLQRLERALVVGDGVLVRVRGLARLGGLQGEHDRLRRPADLASLEVVMASWPSGCASARSRGRPRCACACAAAALDRPVVERLADERVSERETVDFLVVLDDQARRDRQLERADQLVLLLPLIDRHAEPEVGPQRRRERQRFERLGRSRSRRRPITPLTPGGTPAPESRTTRAQEPSMKNWLPPVWLERHRRSPARCDRGGRPPARPPLSAQAAEVDLVEGRLAPQVGDQP